MRQIQLITTLGSGSFGTVYKGELIGSQGVRRTVAVKVLARNHAGRDMFLSRIRDEARLLGLLEDDYILKVLELLRIEGRDGVMMEYVEGVDMATLVEQRLYAPPRALASLGAIVAGALYKAHVAVHPGTGAPLNVVHRDVKPANVMLTGRGGVKLLDFGVAKAAFESRESYTGQLVLGTLNYMAPEYLVTGSLSPSVDIYGLALLMIECATGQVFGQPKLRQDKFEAKRERYLAGLPAEYDELIEPLRRMLAWEPAERPDGATVERWFLDIADESRGTGLRRWCAEAVPQAMAARPSVNDGEGLCGQTVIIEGGEAFISPTQGDSTSPALDPTQGVHSGVRSAARSDARQLKASDSAVRKEWKPPGGDSGGRSRAQSPADSGARKGATPAHRSTILQGLLLGSALGVLAIIVMMAVLLFMR
ncbi:MAG: serine/threonine protein kinase [Alphaproteobacteria bacterium]|nr:serine/threonine protein kinase [Alphaproteobacteria bacterium]